MWRDVAPLLQRRTQSRSRAARGEHLKAQSYPAVAKASQRSERRKLRRCNGRYHEGRVACENARNIALPRFAPCHRQIWIINRAELLIRLDSRISANNRTHTREMNRGRIRARRRVRRNVVHFSQEQTAGIETWT